MKGKYPKEYLRNPNINKPIEQIWDDIESYTGEYFEDEKNLLEKIDFVIPIPPLQYKNKTTKGLMFTQGMGYVLKCFPKLKEIFFCCAYSMWSSYSWFDNADIYLCCYENKQREMYHKNKYQRKKDIIFIPLQDADFINEYKMAPTFNTPKTIDVICVSTAYEVKNLPILAKAIRIYEKKYNKILKTTFVLGSKVITKDNEGNIDYSKAPNSQKIQLNEVMSILKESKKNVDFIPWANHDELKKLYTASKCSVLASLIEGKNRSINEAISCNTPVVVFKDHNKYSRGNHPIFYENSGELVKVFDPEALADTIHKVINNQDDYEPRKNYLKYCGRKNFVNKLTQYIPYYRENIPDFTEGYFHENIWLDLATQADYQLGYMDFLYGKNCAIQHVRGMNNIEKLVKFFYSRFKIKE